jgi:CVNH domain-containing protein
VTVTFADCALSFMLSEDATFEGLADRLDRLGERHHGKPAAIEVKLAAAYAPERRRLVAMKISLGTFAVLLIAGSMFLQLAHAQSVPQGSYRTSCTDIRVEDRTLTAVCRIADGREQRTSLTDVNRCVGDIANDNGMLTCGHGPPMAPYRQDRR